MPAAGNVGAAIHRARLPTTYLYAGRCTKTVAEATHASRSMACSLISSAVLATSMAAL